MNFWTIVSAICFVLFLVEAVPAIGLFLLECGTNQQAARNSRTVRTSYDTVVYGRGPIEPGAKG